VEVSNKHLPPNDWFEDEVTDLDQMNAPIINYSNKWAKNNILELKDDEVKLKYELMGDLDSQSFELEYEE
jgi:predicted nucleotide-binding protein (sugar kinase/HSP70/actin superfamily)